MNKDVLLAQQTHAAIGGDRWEHVLMEQTGTGAFPHENVSHQSRNGGDNPQSAQAILNSC